MTSGIYQILNTITGTKYIGSAINLEKRLYMHKVYLNGNKHANTHLQRAWNKYGESAFTFKIIRKVHPSCLLIVEQSVIGSHKFEDLYNICKVAGSQLGRKWSEETKQKISNSLKGRTLSVENRRKLAEANKGRIVSQETRNKLSIANKGRPMKESQKLELSLARKGISNIGRIGKKHSPETIQKMRDDRKGKPSHRKGVKMSDETKLKLSLSKKGTFASEETKKKLSEMRQGRTLSDAHRAAIANGLKGRKLSPEHIEAMRLSKTGIPSPKKGKIFKNV